MAGVVEGCLVGWEQLQPENAYSAVEEHRARAVAWMFGGSVPHFELTR